MPEVFNGSKHADCKLESPEGIKIVTVRFPTDAEAIERARKRKIIVKQLGRGISETLPIDSSEYDAELIQKLIVGDAPEIDGYEATQILERLMAADVDEIEREGDGYRVTLRVFDGIMTKHLLRMPSAKEKFKYERTAFHRLDLPLSRRQITVNLQAAADLDSALRKESSGYDGEIPIYHKAEVIRAITENIEAGFGAAGQENF
jgi:hypothetical protein